MSNEPQLHVLIVDDEQYVRDHLTDLLNVRSEVKTVSEATSGREAIQTINAEDPDLVFLDVKMPSLSGIEVVEAIGPASMPATVFVTAYDEFAIQAFDLAAVDYLLKPFEENRFAKAFERAHQAIRLERAEELVTRFEDLLDVSADRVASFGNGTSQHRATDPASSSPETNDYLERLTIETRGQIRIVHVEDICYITAEDMYVRIHTAETSYLLRKRLYEMEERLDPAQFIRIHRSTIVRLDCIDRLVQRSGSDYVVQLDDAKTLSVSRSRQDDLIQRLETGAPA